MLKSNFKCFTENTYGTSDYRTVFVIKSFLFYERKSPPTQLSANQTHSEVYAYYRSNFRREEGGDFSRKRARAVVDYCKRWFRESS